VDHGAAAAGAARLSGRVPSFAVLARRPDAGLDALALALAAEFRAVDAAAALAALDGLGAELAEDLARGPSGDSGAPAGDGAERASAEARACAELLGRRHGFAGDQERYDDPRNSMLDVVLERRCGLPILLSVVYVEVARRAGVALAGVGLPGHFVVGHFGGPAPVLLDPFAGGAEVEGEPPAALVRPWGPHETALRMLNNLVASFQRRGDLARAIRAATLRLALPADAALHDALETELRAMRARLN